MFPDRHGDNVAADGAPRRHRQEDMGMTQDTSVKGRRVVANISLSLDGRVSGRGGEQDMGGSSPTPSRTRPANTWCE